MTNLGLGLGEGRHCHGGAVTCHKLPVKHCDWQDSAAGEGEGRRASVNERHRRMDRLDSRCRRDGQTYKEVEESGTELGGWGAAAPCRKGWCGSTGKGCMPVLHTGSESLADINFKNCHQTQTNHCI